MALRSVAGKLGTRLLRWAKASGDALPPPAAASDRIKFEGSFEELPLAIERSIMGHEWHIIQECRRRTRKNYRDSAIIAAAGVGLITYFWSCADEALDEFLNAKRKAEEGSAVEGKAIDAKEEGSAVEGKAVDAKEEGKPMD